MDQLSQKLSRLATDLADADSKHAEGLYSLSSVMSAEPPPPPIEESEDEAFNRRQYRPPRYAPVKEEIVSPSPKTRSEEEIAKDVEKLKKDMLKTYESLLPKSKPKSRWDASVDQLAQQLHALGSMKAASELCELRDVLAATPKKKAPSKKKEPEAPSDLPPVGPDELARKLLTIYRDTMKEMQEKGKKKVEDKGSPSSEEGVAEGRKSLASFLDIAAQVLDSCGLPKQASDICEIRDLFASNFDYEKLNDKGLTKIKDPKGNEVDLRQEEDGWVVVKVHNNRNLPGDWVEGAFLVDEEVKDWMGQ